MSGNLGDVYHEPADPASYGTAWKLWDATGEKKEKITEYLQGEDAYTLHKPARRHFPRNVTYADNIDESWQTDLSDFQSLKKDNDGFSYILCVIDVFSKFAWAVPLKDKSAPSIIKGFQTIFKTTDRRPTRLFSDKGKEYINKTFQKFLKENNITYIHTHNPDIKCSIVERWQRTIKSKLFKRFTYTEKYRYVDGLLDDIVDAYNHTFHRSIKMRPVDVTPDRMKKLKSISLPALPFSSVYPMLARTLLTRKYAELKPIDISLGVPSQMFIYMDVLEEQIVGHTRAPLLRTVPVDTKAQYGSMTVVHFDHPIYFDLRTKSFDTLEIYIKDHAGRNVPFDFGTTMTRQDHITEYYLRQAGGGQYYAGSSYQKGHGIGSWLGGLFRTVLPLLKSGATAVGREAARAGAHVLADVASGDPIADSAKRHAGEAVQNLKRRAAAAMSGSGRSIKRKRLAPKRHSAAKARSRRSHTPDYFT
ncbi:Putative uncharacterized transposon-derived protein [Frankliniella fusca]|uniref:Uncharacterized transposon-derived protein n=1 Tax=Frankliniella fusca TaxID=407009 RepID=A0AAE1L561_9NEOP|nr:Putative uncharacterized transposon-derived protein [Frankliniella fusca]